MSPPEQESAIVAYLAGDQRIASARLLGSAASGRLRFVSDIDIAVQPADAAVLTAADRAALAAGLAEVTSREVDLGSFDSANLVYAAQSIFTGRVIFERRPGVAATRAADTRLTCEEYSL